MGDLGASGLKLVPGAEQAESSGVLTALRRSEEMNEAISSTN